jgi:hypothetical protein
VNELLKKLLANILYFIVYCILASCLIRFTLNICSFVHDGQKNKYSVKLLAFNRKKRDITSCSSLKIRQPFGATSRFYLQGRRMIEAGSQHEADIKCLSPEGTCHHIFPRSWKCGSVHARPHTSAWHSALIVKHRNNFNFFSTFYIAETRFTEPREYNWGAIWKKK